MKLQFSLILIIISASLFGQSKVEKLFRSKQYDELVELKSDSKKYSGKDLYWVGKACMIKNMDTAAVRIFNISIKKGYENAYLYYDLGITYNNLRLHRDAIEALNNALHLKPVRKPFLLEKAAAWYSLQNLDSALATYEFIQRHFPENQLSSFMVCQIKHEMEKYNQCLECYYESLFKYKDKNRFYRESLENIARLEWYEFKRYDRAEVAIKNLMDAYPSNYQYTIWLIQLYHEQDKFIYTDVLDQRLMDAYGNGDLSKTLYQKESYLIDAFVFEHRYLEVYRNFVPDKREGEVYRVFVLTENEHNPIGKISTYKDTIGYDLSYTIYGDSIHFEEELKYENLKKSVKYLLLNPPLSEPTDTLMIEKN